MEFSIRTFINDKEINQKELHNYIICNKSIDLIFNSVIDRECANKLE